MLFPRHEDGFPAELLNTCIRRVISGPALPSSYTHVCKLMGNIGGHGETALRARGCSPSH